MRHLFSSRFMRISMVFVLALGICNETNAQFGGLLNAAKRKAKEAVTNKATDVVTNKATDVVTNKANDAVNNKANDAANTAVNGNIIPLYYTNGNPMGEWNPETRQYTQIGKVGNEYKRAHVYTFQSNGSVVVGDGRRIGEILPDGTMNTAQTQGIKYNPQTGEVTRNGEWYGKIDDSGMYLFNDKMGWAQAAMDKQIQAFILFNLIATNEMLTEFKQKYDEKVKFNQEMRQQQIANAKADEAASRSGGSAGAVKLWKGGSTVGEIRSNNEVWLRGSNRGKIESNGNIWVGGSVAGQILSNGDIRKGGSIVGKVQGGKVWLGGSIVGEIRQNGDVVKGGSVIGRAEGMKDARKVAVVYFFGFYNF